jgi:hypothetical protein
MGVFSFFGIDGGLELGTQNGVLAFEAPDLGLHQAFAFVILIGGGSGKTMRVSVRV